MLVLGWVTAIEATEVNTVVELDHSLEQCIPTSEKIVEDTKGAVDFATDNDTAPAEDMDEEKSFPPDVETSMEYGNGRKYGSFCRR